MVFGDKFKVTSYSWFMIPRVAIIYIEENTLAVKVTLRFRSLISFSA